MKKAVLGVAARLFPHDSRKVIAPAGPWKNGKGPNIIVASIMRSGTHLLMDLLFNNFPHLKKSPLYVYFERAAEQGTPASSFENAKGTVIKTHFPQLPLTAEYEQILRSLAENSLVILPERDIDRIWNSLKIFEHDCSFEELATLKREWMAYWEQFNPLIVNFDDLLHADSAERLLNEISARLGIPWKKNRKPILASPTRLRAYCDKLITRAAGGAAPRINTTIAYRLPAPPTEAEAIPAHGTSRDSKGPESIFELGAELSRSPFLPFITSLSLFL